MFSNTLHRPKRFTIKHFAYV
ncbi:rCG37610, partial [Rattus norvegicus]